jgi:thiol-disulfide isomerase/thioredoxin
MNPLTQDTLEALLQFNDPSPLVIVYFTAKWCGPCNRVRLQEVVSARPDAKWYLCDVDENDYSLGYCGGSSIPAWLPIVKGKAGSLYVQSNMEAILYWIKSL